MKTCTNCGATCQEGLMKGSGWIEVILWLCYIVPGLIYSIWRRSGEQSICPTCKKETLIPAVTASATSNSQRVEVTCEWCAEPILASAKVCKHCGKEVTPQSSSSYNEPAITEQPTITPTKEKRKGSSVGKAVAWGFGIFFFFGFLAIIGNDPSSNSSSSSKATSQSAKKYTAGLVSGSFVCKAATAEHMGRKVKTMSSSKVGSKYHITYRRPSDNSKWGVYCWLQGNRVLWQTDGANGTGSNGKPGRVRNGQWDEVITYSIKPNRLTINIKYSDGSKTTQVYKVPKNG